MQIPENEWTTMKATIVRLEESIGGLEKSLGRIEVAIVGDEKMRIRGFADYLDSLSKKIKAHEIKLDQIDAIKDRGRGIVIGVSAVMGLIGVGIWEGIRYLIFGK